MVNSCTELLNIKIKNISPQIRKMILKTNVNAVSKYAVLYSLDEVQSAIKNISPQIREMVLKTNVNAVSKYAALHSLVAVQSTIKNISPQIREKVLKINVNMVSSANALRLLIAVQDIIIKSKVSLDFKPIALNTLAKNIQGIGHESLEFNADGTITSIAYPETVVNINDVQNMIDSCIDNNDIVTGINQIIEMVNSKKDSLFKQVLIGIITGLITYLITCSPFLNDFADQLFDKKASTKLLKKSVVSLQLSKEFYTDYRFVSTNCLNVRISNTLKSNIVGKLYFGQVIQIIEKRKNWTLVEYRYEDVYIRGWVFTRYISKFK